MRYYIGIGGSYQIKPHSYEELDDVIAFLKDLDDCQIVDVIENCSEDEPKFKYAEIVFDCFYAETLLKLEREFELYVDPSEEITFNGIGCNDEF